MSSAILYLAIVAIWAGVLIPRWLRRGAEQETALPGTGTGTEPGDAVPSARDAYAGGGAGADAGAEDATGAEGADGRGGGRDLAPPPPLTAGESRRRMLTARRRLLGMLVALEAAAIALAMSGLAALWVVIPPTLMLAGYLMLLREASKADAEHAAREAEAVARAAAARARARERAKARAAASRAAADASAGEAGELAARYAAAPVPADYEDGGRDFAPGLAGKYTTSHEEQEYPQRHLRAVGD